MQFISSFFKRRFGIHTNIIQEEIPVRGLCTFSPRFEIENHAILQEVPTLSATYIIGKVGGRDGDSGFPPIHPRLYLDN